MLGDFTFLEPTLVYPKYPILRNSTDVIHDNFPYLKGNYKAIINRIDEIVEVNVNELDSFCEESLDNYESYLIPSLYNGFIEIQ